MRTVLMICDRFPPHSASGTQRPLQFVKHLPSFGYRPIVLSTSPEAGDVVDASPLRDLDPRCEVRRPDRLMTRLTPVYGRARARLVELARASASLARTPASVAASTGDGGDGGHARVPPGAAAEVTAGAVAPPAVPGPWVPPRERRDELGLKDKTYYALNWLIWFHADWTLPVVRESLAAARARPIDLVWATSPNPRNLLAGYAVSLLLRKPFVADLRDPWTYGSIWDPLYAWTGHLERWWAQRILQHAARVVFTSPLTQAEMARRFPGPATARMCTITNGFAGDGAAAGPLRSVAKDKLLFSYNGSLNQRRRPDVLLRALSENARDPGFARDVRLQFVGGLGPHGNSFEAHGVTAQAVDVGHVGYGESLGYMAGADVNVLLQSIHSGQDVIAGKTFEYLASAKPVLAVVAPDGGDAWLLRQTGGARIVDFRDPAAVAEAMRGFYRAWKAGEPLAGPDPAAIARYSHRALTGELSALFDAVLAEG